MQSIHRGEITTSPFVPCYSFTLLSLHEGRLQPRCFKVSQSCRFPPGTSQVHLEGRVADQSLRALLKGSGVIGVSLSEDAVNLQCHLASFSSC